MGGDSRLSLVLRTDPLYTVTRDEVADGVTVTVGDHLLMKTPGDERTLDVNGHVSATVNSANSQAAYISGKSTTRASTVHGEYVVRAQLLLSRETAVITGDVSFEGEPVFNRRWTA